MTTAAPRTDGACTTAQPAPSAVWTSVVLPATVAAVASAAVFWAWARTRPAYHPRALAHTMADHSTQVSDAARAEARGMKSSVAEARHRAAHTVIDALDDVEDVWDEDDDAVTRPSQTNA